eukprot:jgi/Mesen1/9745/ME000695S09055
MFSTKQRLKERTGKYGTTRFDYLQALVTEFQEATNEEAKEQVVANLANFAYDPVNYEHLRKLHAVDLFLDCLTEPSERLVEFGMGGICNCCPDPKNAAVIIESDGIPLIIGCLSSPVENTVLSAMAALYFLCAPATKKQILSPAVVALMEQYAAASAVNVRFSNTAQAFLDKHVHGRRSESAKRPLVVATGSIL